MRKLVVLASALTLRRALLGYAGVKRVEGKTAEQPASDRETRAVVDDAQCSLKHLAGSRRRSDDARPHRLSRPTNDYCIRNPNWLVFHVSISFCSRSSLP
jgi:hypothetical protein